MRFLGGLVLGFQNLTKRGGFIMHIFIFNRRMHRVLLSCGVDFTVALLRRTCRRMYFERDWAVAVTGVVRVD